MQQVTKLNAGKEKEEKEEGEKEEEVEVEVEVVDQLVSQRQILDSTKLRHIECLMR
jgi:hypothetical protein